MLKALLLPLLVLSGGPVYDAASGAPIGTLTSGKDCTYDGTAIVCTTTPASAVTTINAVTAGVAPTSANAGQWYVVSNGNTYTVTLPADGTGVCYTFLNIAGALKLQAAAGDTIQNASSTSAAGGYLCMPDASRHMALQLCGVSDSRWYRTFTAVSGATLDSGC